MSIVVARTIATLVLVCSFATQLAIAQEAAQLGRRLAPPPSREIDKALAEIRDVFREEYSAATTPTGRLALARQLLTQAEKSTAPAERWALYSETIRLGVEAGNPDLTFDSLAKWEQVFAMDGDAIRLESLTRLATKTRPQDADALGRSALVLARKAMATNAADVAAKSLTIASSCAKKAGNRSLVAEVATFQQQLKEAEKAAKERAAIEEKLAAAPGNPDACLDGGKYYCFKMDDWQRGLPLLAQGADERLKALAQAEIAMRPSAVAIEAVADQWWEYADNARGDARQAAMVHAADLYATVIGQTQGLDRARLEKRIQQAGSSGKRIEKTVSLAKLPIKAVHDAWRGVEKDGKHMDQPFYCGGKAWPEALTTTPSRGSLPRIEFDVPEGYRRLRGRVGIFTMNNDTNDRTPLQIPVIFEIVLDGAVAWQSQPLGQRNESEGFDVSLAGAKTLSLRTRRATDGEAKHTWASWLETQFVR